MKQSEYDAMKALIQQQILLMCEKLGVKTDAETIIQVGRILISRHKLLSEKVSGAGNQQGRTYLLKET